MRHKPNRRTSAAQDLPREDGITGLADVSGFCLTNPDTILGKQGPHIVIREMADEHELYDVNLRRNADAQTANDLRDARASHAEPEIHLSVDRLNIAHSGPENSHTVDRDPLQAIAGAVANAMQAHRVTGAIKVRTIRGVPLAAGAPVLGTYRAGQISVNADGSSRSTRPTAR